VTFIYDILPLCVQLLWGYSCYMLW